MGRARQIYENVKNKFSFRKYESDCQLFTLNGENNGNITHPWKFAQDVVNKMSITITSKLNRYFDTPYLI